MSEEISVQSTAKEQLEEKLEKIKEIKQVISYMEQAKQAYENKQIDISYLHYLENSLVSKFFSSTILEQLHACVLLEVVCLAMNVIEKVDIDKIEIQKIGTHYEECIHYIDYIVTYGNQFLCLFGINESDGKQYIPYEKRKFNRADFIEAIKIQCNTKEDISILQYDEYYMVEEKDNLKVFSERKELSLMKLEDTIFDKIRAKFSNIWGKGIFSKKKCLPNIDLIYETNGNRLANFEVHSKIEAKKRIKELLNEERKQTRSI